MPKFHVNADVTGGKYLGCFDADTAEEAIEMAIMKNGYISLCHQCASELENAEIGDATAEPADDNEEAEEE